MKKMSDQEFRRCVMEHYGKLQAAVRDASQAMVSRESKSEQVIAWRLVDDIRGELLGFLEQCALAGDQKGGGSMEDFDKLVAAVRSAFSR